MLKSMQRFTICLILNAWLCSCCLLSNERPSDKRQAAEECTPYYCLSNEQLPRTCDGAINFVYGRLTADNVMTLQRLSSTDLYRYNLTWGRYIREGLAMRDGNTELVQSCRKKDLNSPQAAESASEVIIESVWRRANPESVQQAKEQVPFLRPYKPISALRGH